MFKLVETVQKRGKNGFTACIVVGRRRIGKSVYSLKCVYQLKKSQGETDAYAWHYALNSLVFTMDDLIKKVERHSYRNKADAIIYDDCGFTASGLLYLYNIRNAMLMKGIMDTIGTRCRLLMLTTPNVSSLMKFMRKYSDFIAQVSIKESTIRNATVWKPYSGKNFSERWRRAWADDFSVQIPDDIYLQYVKIRDRYTNKILKELKRYGKGEKILRQNEFEGSILAGQSELFPDVDEPDIQSNDL